MVKWGSVLERWWTPGKVMVHTQRVASWKYTSSSAFLKREVWLPGGALSISLAVSLLSRKETFQNYHVPRLVFSHPAFSFRLKLNFFAW